MTRWAKSNVCFYPKSKHLSASHARQRWLLKGEKLLPSRNSAHGTCRRGGAGFEGGDYFAVMAFRSARGAAIRGKLSIPCPVPST
jgi:hypothetical protein